MRDMKRDICKAGTIGVIWMSDSIYRHDAVKAIETSRFLIDAIEKGCFDTLKDGHFQTIAQEKGKHTLNGLYKIERFKNEAYFPFQINYYVK